MAELVEKLEEQTLVRLPSYQRKWLRERRHHEGVSHADSVRQALDMLIEAEARRAERRAKSNGD